MTTVEFSRMFMIKSYQAETDGRSTHLSLSLSLLEQLIRFFSFIVLKFAISLPSQAHISFHALHLSVIPE